MNNKKTSTTKKKQPATKAPQLLGYQVTRCPYCQKDIALPEYKLEAITMNELKKYTRAKLDADNKKDKQQEGEKDGQTR